MSWFQLRSGRHFHFKNALDEPDSFYAIQDIAHSLAHLCRFGGHSKVFYSVATHSYLGANLVPPPHRLAFLLHDATEAYLGDLVKPLKDLPEMSYFEEFEEKLQKRIYRRFGLAEEMPKSVKLADFLMLIQEARVLMDASYPDWERWFSKEPQLMEELGEVWREWDTSQGEDLFTYALADVRHELVALTQQPPYPTETKEAFLAEFHQWQAKTR